MMIPLAGRGRAQETDRRVALVDTDSKVMLRGAVGTVNREKTGLDLIQGSTAVCLWYI